MTTISELHEDAALVVTGPPQWAGELELREAPGPEAALLMMNRQGDAIAFSPHRRSINIIGAVTPFP